jgi:hypothetical protein
MSLNVALAKISTVDSIPVTFGGFQPNEWVAVVIRSTPQMLATAQADSRGNISTTVSLPGDFAPGEHTLSVLGSVSGVGGSASISVTSTNIPGLTTLTPSRIVNTRPTGKVGALDGNGAPLTINVYGKGGLPSSGISAVALNVTVVDSEAGNSGGYVTVYPCANGRPDSSNLNFITGQIIPNSVIAPVDTQGNVCFYVYGKAHILADVSGYFSQ